MNLLQFTWRTAKMLFAIPVGFGYGVVQLLIDGEPLAAAILGLSGLQLCLFTLLMTASHRRTLDRRNVQAYVRQLIHNRNTAPFTLPTEEEAQWVIDHKFNNPLS